MKLRCYLLSLLRIHRRDCEHCKAREKCGLEMRERLEELNWRTPPRSLNSGDHGKAVKVFDSKPEVVARTLISLAQSGRRLLKANGACCEYPDAIPQAMKITLEDALSVLRKYAEERTPVLAAFVTPSVSVARVTGAIRVSTVAGAPVLLVGKEDGESDQIKFGFQIANFSTATFVKPVLKILPRTNLRAFWS